MCLFAPTINDQSDDAKAIKRIFVEQNRKKLSNRVGINGDNLTVLGLALALIFSNDGQNCEIYTHSLRKENTRNIGAKTHAAFIVHISLVSIW